MVATMLLSIMTACTGLFCGFIVAMTSVVQAMLDDLSAAEYARVMQRIIERGRQSVIVKILLLLPLALSIVVLVLTWQNRSVFLLTLTGALVFFAGALLVSRQIAEPLYDVMMNWDIEALPPDWGMCRQRWLQINLIRAASAFAAFVLFGTATLYLS